MLRPSVSAHELPPGRRRSLGRTSAAFLGASWLAAVAGACGDGDSGGDGDVRRGAPVRPATVEVVPESLTLRAGESRRLLAVPRSEAGRRVSGLRVEWSSSDPGRASVSPDGLVTAVAPGSARVVAVAADESGGAVVRVLPPPSVRFRELAAGGSQTCGLDLEGRAYCWGFNRHGQAGLGRLTDREPNPFPRPVAGGIRYRALAAGFFHTCGVTAEGAAHCWGNNFYGQLGGGEPTGLWDGIPRPVRIEAPSPFVEVRPMGWVTCGLAVGGDPYCWGRGDRGQLGPATPEGECDPPRGDPVPCARRPLRVRRAPDFITIVLGSQHACGLEEDGTVHCWGRNGSGQLGDGTRTGRSEPGPVAGDIALVALAAAFGHTCGLTEAGTAWCWGANAHGQLGDGTNVNRSAPVRAAPGLRFTRLALGGLHTCGLTPEGEAWCWGENNKGQLGDGSRLERRRPVAVSGDLHFSLLAAGVRHTCGLTHADVAYCWGGNGRGQLGDGTTEARIVPVRVADPLPPLPPPE